MVCRRINKIRGDVVWNSYYTEIHEQRKIEQSDLSTGFGAINAMIRLGAPLGLSK